MHVNCFSTKSGKLNELKDHFHAHHKGYILPFIWDLATVPTLQLKRKRIFFLNAYVSETEGGEFITLYRREKKDALLHCHWELKT